MPLDDGWIHLQFARNLALGEGLAYHSGEWMPGSTAPLWTALLSLGFLLPLSPLLWSKGLGVALHLASVAASARLGAELGLGRGLSHLAAILVATTPWLLWSALSGMEIPLFICLSLWGLILHLREKQDPRRPAASLALFAAAVLARPEGYLLLALALFDRLLPRREKSARRLGAALILPALILIPTLAFYWLSSGSPLPTTFAVKASSPFHWLPSGRYLKTVVEILFESQPLMLIVAGGGVLRLVERGATRHLLPALWLLGLPLAYSFLAPAHGPAIVGNFGRYLFPLIPLVAIFGLLGCQRLVASFATPRIPRLLLISLLLGPQIWGMLQGAGRYTQTIANVEDSDVKAAHWLGERLHPEALLAVQDIGALKYFLPNRVLDLVGIVNPDIAPYLHGNGPDDPTYWEERLLDYLGQHRPDFLVVFPGSYPMLTSQTPGFERLRSFEIRGNVTMAGNTLAVFSTPWTRYPLETIDSRTPRRQLPDDGQ
jgi:hypothetical protein